MPYTTISIKLLRPSQSKRRFLDDAFRAYSMAFEQILRSVAGSASDLGKKGDLMKRMDKELMSGVDELGAQPFKDALKLDVSMLLSGYHGRVRQGMKAGFPLTRSEDDDLQQALCEVGETSKARLNALLLKYRQDRPVLFPRFDTSRDYAILKAPDSGDYFLKLYLFSLKNALLSVYDTERPLVYLTNGEPLTHNRAKKRYLVLPLQVGERQKRYLADVESGNAAPKSAILVKKGKEYYLNVKLWYEPQEPAEAETFLGLARGVSGELYYTLCTHEGELLEQGSLSPGNAGGRNRLHLLVHQATKLAKQHSSKLILANLTRSDGLGQRGWSPRLSVNEYKKLVELLTHKAELEGLQKPVLVSSTGIYYRCPCCGSFKYTNRMNRDIFLCTSCGYSQKLEKVGAGNLARALLNYNQSRLAVTYASADGQLEFYCKLLNLRVALPADEQAVAGFFAALEDYIAHLSQQKLTRKQMSFLKKVEAAQDLRSLVEFVENDPRY